jgi:hypothetical protein
MYGHQCVPMVRRSNLYGIYVLTFQQTLVFFVHIAAHGHILFLLPFSHVAAETFALDTVNIASGCYLYARAGSKAAEVAASLLSQSYES